MDGATTRAIATVVLVPAPEPAGEWISEGSSLTTVVETQPATTYVIGISGTPTTVITTPPPKTEMSTAPISWGPKTITRSAGDRGGDSSHNETTIIVDVATYHLTPPEYFGGAFLPALIAMLLRIPIALIDTNAKSLQPFHALTQDGGATVSQSLTLTCTGVLNSFVQPYRLLFHGQPVTYLTSLLTWCSLLLVPLSSEAIGLRVYGRCIRFSIQGCAVDFGVSPSPTRALVVSLAVMTTLLGLLLYYLGDWKTGVYAYPSSVAGIATLTRDQHLKAAMPISLPKGRSCGKMDKLWEHSLKNRLFKFGFLG
ncbi:hypothetical protein B0H66DRAFT_589030 [Apodospora peruviana]|uniref:Uncharacterized protein n=1 Tax=Apodospora peruviana TaxID=516989 RepID=A0AAE0MBT8_9PEZI|nr:hypothetical protein B0H66DRAFT_589030 [Apodospora peruviana]